MHLYTKVNEKYKKMGTKKIKPTKQYLDLVIKCTVISDNNAQFSVKATMYTCTWFISKHRSCIVNRIWGLKQQF